MITLENTNLKLDVYPGRGGLISSITYQNDPILFMQEGFDVTASSWPGCGLPLLFPFSGRVFYEQKQGQYFVNGQIYNMPIHGFGYGIEWQVKKVDQNQILLGLRSSEASLAIYPWNFDCEYAISIDEHSINFLLTVKNLGFINSDKTEASPLMPVYPGIHPYFLTNKTPFEIVPKGLETMLDVTGLGEVGKSRELATDMQFDLSSAYSKNNIWVHSNYSENKIRTGNVTFTIAGKESKYTVLWRDDENSFQCVEPWVGVPNAVGFSDLTGKANQAHPYSSKLLKPDQSKKFEFFMKFD